MVSHFWGNQVAVFQGVYHKQDMQQRLQQILHSHCHLAVVEH